MYFNNKYSRRKRRLNNLFKFNLRMFRQNGNKKNMYVGKVAGKNQCCVSGSGLISFSRIRIRKNHSGSKQLQLPNVFEVKLFWKTGKIWQFLNKNAQLKTINSFLSKKYSPESLNFVIMSNLTHLQGRNTKANLCQEHYAGSGSETNWKK